MKHCPGHGRRPTDPVRYPSSGTLLVCDGIGQRTPAAAGRSCLADYGVELPDVPPLPRSLDGPRVVVVTDVVHRVGRWHAVNDCQAGQGRAGPALAAAAGHLNPLDRCPPLQLTHRVAGVGTVKG